MRFAIFILLISTQFVLTGCAVTNFFSPKNTLEPSSDNRDDVVVDDIVLLLQRYLAPAKTTLYVDPSKSLANKEFSSNILERLRGTGYAVSSTYQYRATIPFVWHIDTLSKSAIRATYSIANAKVTRFYRKKDGYYRPYGQFTIWGLGAPRYRARKLPARIKKERRDPSKLSYKDYSKTRKTKKRKRKYHRIHRLKHKGHHKGERK